MKYFKVIVPDKRDYFTGYCTIKDELLTAKERNTRFPHLSDNVFKEVELSRKKTYTFFGARFEMR